MTNLKQWMITLLILGWLAWHLALPVDFISSDLGRYIKNGELILQGQGDVLYKNYYSYTYPQYPFLNYHWFFGVLCFVFWHYFGFSALSFVYLILELFTFYLFFRCSLRYVSFPNACAFALLSFPFLSFRSEIRPEGVSYLCCALFWWLIDAYQQRRIKSPHLIIALCAIEIIWANTHIFFMMGPALMALLGWQAYINSEKEQAQYFKKLCFLLLGMCLINPFGLQILSVMFSTWSKATLFPIIESQSVFYVLKTTIIAWKPVLLYFLGMLSILSLSLFFLIRREGLRKHSLIGILFLILSLAALKEMRMIGLWGYFWIPISTYVYSGWMRTKTERSKKNMEIFLVTIGIIVSATVNFNWKQKPALGLVPGSNDAAEFFQREKITGRIFNNYGIGGYLIFHLSPQHQFFIDNRGVAAFPEDFVTKTYGQMQGDDHIWHQLEQEYRFNVIFCYPERSYWGVKFLDNRLKDPDWALVFLGEKARIFLRRNAQNADIIRRNEIFIYQQEAENYTNSGYEDDKQGHFIQAMAELNKAIESNPQYPDAYINRGNVYFHEGRLVQAIGDYSKALELNSQDALAYQDRAIVYYKLKEYNNAWSDVHKAEALGAADNPVLINLLKQSFGRGK